LDSRLSWRFVAAVVLIAGLAVAFDFGWRVLMMPLETYLLIFGLIAAVIVIAIVGTWLLCRARATNREPQPLIVPKTR
jgi:uncharacterized membrane protein AbrB (regulator of aidB expression)